MKVQRERRAAEAAEELLNRARHLLRIGHAGGVMSVMPVMPSSR